MANDSYSRALAISHPNVGSPMSNRARLAIITGCLWTASFAVAQADPLLLVTSSRAGNADLFLLDIDTGDAFNLTRNPAYDAYPAWSRDGKKIAFASNRNGNMNLFTIDPDGSNLKQLTDEQSIDRGPGFSPDGKRIAFTRRPNDEETTSIHVIDTDGSNEKRLRENAFDPAWSPDGKKIAFTSPIADKGFKICVMDADGKNAEEFATNDNRFGFVYPAWSPDGKKIAYTDMVGNDLEIFVIDADGKNAKQLTKQAGLNSYALWSPDGKKILFQHHDQNRNPGPMYQMDADGGNVVVIPVLRSERYAEGGRAVWKPE